MTETTGQVRTGGRSARIRAAVHRAVGDLLVDESAEALTIPMVAARAGVHPTTVYRRWGSMAQLLSDVASSRFSGDIVVPDTGSLLGDLERWVTDVATDLTDPDVLALIRASIGSGGAGACACTADRHAQLAAILERERDRSGSAPEFDAAIDGLLGPLYYRAVMTDRPVPVDWARRLVAALLAPA